MRSPAMVQNVLIVRLQLGGLVESIRGIFSTVLGQTHHSQPHPCCSVLWIAYCFFPDGSGGIVQMIQSELGNAQKQVCSMQPRFERQCFLKAGNGVLMAALLLANQG